MHRPLQYGLAGLALVSAAAAQTPAQLRSVSARAPIHAGTFHVASGQFLPANGAARGSSADVVYASNHYTGFYYDINNNNFGITVTDEGRLPSLTSPTTAPLVSPVSVTGVSNSYRITEIQLGYVTDATAGANITAQLTIYDQYDPCTDPTATGSAVLDITITGLPGTISPGSLTPYTFDVDMTGLEFCMRADGDGQYDGTEEDLFGWSLTMTTDPSFQVGPIVGSRPGAFAPTGNATVFTPPIPGITSGSGLGTMDQWYNVDNFTNIASCLNWGGYDPVDNDPAFGSFWLVLGSDLNQSCVGCDKSIDDNFEPNDTCGTAVPVTSPGLITDLVAQAQSIDSDFYRVTVPPNTALTANALFSHADGDIDMRLLSGDCFTSLDVSESVTDNESVSFFNCGPAPVDVVVEVYVWDPAPQDCNEYSLELIEENTCVADPFEPNDSCGDAAPIPDGITTGLRITECDDDYYSFSLDHGDTMDITMTFNGLVHDIDLFLFTDDVNCGTFAGLLASSTSVASFENIVWTNMTGETQSYVLRSTLFSSSAALPCAAYQLVLDRNAGSPIGDNYCVANINSSGSAASIFATGSDVVADNDLTLNCRFLPLFQFGIFIVSQSNIIVPNAGGSDGNLCIAGPSIGRYNQPGTIGFSGFTGVVTLPINLNLIPQPMVFVPAMVGDTWNFQYWTRDFTPGLSNYSDALAITFQ